MRRRALILATLIATIGCPAAAFATVFRVDASNSSLTQNGATWATSFQYLQDALAAAAADTAGVPHTIRLAQGTYYPDEGAGQTPGDRDAAFAMLNNVTIQGGYRGIAGLPSNADDRNISLYVTILSGDLDGDDSWPHVDGLNQTEREENSKHIVLAWSVDDSAVLDGVIVSDAESFDDNDADGGGVWVDTSDAQFSNCTIRRCRVGIDRLGGGMWVHLVANPLITGCTFEDNEGGSGGGMAVSLASEGTIETSVFQNCRATGGGGGGLLVNFSSSTVPTLINNSQFINNEHTPNGGTFQFIAGGGGILLFDRAAAVFRGCTIEDNTAFDTPGGGAMVDGATHIFNAINCVFDGNESTYSSGDGGRGGGLFCGAASGKIIDCQFSNNICWGSGDSTPLHGGGGMYGTGGGDGYIVNSLFHDNTAHNGAGLLLTASTTAVHNCTVSQNTAGNLGGGLYVKKSGTIITTLLPTVTYTIVWDNTSTNGTGEQKQFWTDRINTNPIVLTYSCLQDKATSGVLDHATNTASDPLFRDPSSNDFHLTRCSPVIDRGNTLVTPQDELQVDPPDSDTTCTGSCADGERVPDRDIKDRVVKYPFASVGGGVVDNVCLGGCQKIVDFGCFEFQAVCEPSVCAILGDVNGDGYFNGLDIDPFVKCMIGSAPFCGCPCADMDLNGLLEFEPDVGLFINRLLEKEEIPPCDEPGAIVDCNDNDIPDEQDIFGFRTSLDCNGNGVPDECDIADETSTDLNGNDIPDDCETDCNNNNVPDDWDISQSTSSDVNSNDIPDECEPDCNGNDTPDDYDVSTSSSPDCNSNGQPDECEYDCNSNGVPDDCDIDPLDPDGNTLVSEDCNENGIPDECDLSRAILPSFDCNDNNIPDECELDGNDANENGIPDDCEEESLMGGGGGESMMSGGGEGGGEFDEEAAWEAFFEWYDEEVLGEESDWGTFSGSERFHRVMDELQLLGLPYGAIDTPEGLRPIQDIKLGQLVW